MSISINTNVASLSAQKYLASNTTALTDSMERLSSGLRINSAKDDAAGLAIASDMQRQIQSLGQGVKNAEAGISAIQNTESTFSEVTNNIQRMNELAMQAANGTYSSSDRAALQLEFVALRDEIDRTAAVANFNGTALANGSVSSITIQVGDLNTSNDRITVNLTDLRASTLGISAAVSISVASKAQAALDDLDTALSTLNSGRAQLGADESRLETAVTNNSNTIESVTAARSRIMDADVASEVSEMSRANILTQVGTSMLTQANAIPQMALSLLG